MPILMIVAAPVLVWLVGSVAGGYALASVLLEVEATLIQTLPVRVAIH